jgi:hypothetical protein
MPRPTTCCTTNTAARGSWNKLAGQRPLEPSPRSAPHNSVRLHTDVLGIEWGDFLCRSMARSPAVSSCRRLCGADPLMRGVANEASSPRGDGPACVPESRRTVIPRGVDTRPRPGYKDGVEPLCAEKVTATICRNGPKGVRTNSDCHLFGSISFHSFPLRIPDILASAGCRPAQGNGMIETNVSRSPCGGGGRLCDNLSLQDQPVRS